MTIFFSPTTGAFYDDAFWEAPLPDDAVEISAEDHAALLEAASTGKVIQAGPDGAPVAVDAPTPPIVTLAALARRRRDLEVDRLRWLIERHRDEIALGLTTTLTPEDFTLVLQHLQALRDVPEQPGFPEQIDWPELPPELLPAAA
ncbi:MAG: phage tail protein [Brevundimonas sp.]|uniref:phage tail assembly chaperone n=1 Tax=Brevundimonas sp. TaxID=1871086 RepID=UPI000DB595C2|nr:phage tail assembly chaperone [Brevundimonas sp.]PZU74150.1 MAG: phage tail protein [Brevundimonas sp.]